MPDYAPLDLSSVCNAGSALYGAEARPPLGAISFHGLPFLVGGSAPDPTRCFIGLGPDQSQPPVTVAVGAPARQNELSGQARLECPRRQKRQRGLGCPRQEKQRGLGRPRRQRQQRGLGARASACLGSGL